MKNLLKRITKKQLMISGIVFAVWVILPFLLLPNFSDNPEFYNSGASCHVRNAMVSYIDCRNFAGSEVVQFVINLPSQIISGIVLIPIFLVSLVF